MSQLQANRENNLLASVIIPVKDDLRIELLLESLTKQSIDRSLYEIIVIENGSNICKRICEKFDVIYINVPFGNISYARNFGAQRSLSNILLFTDADCMVSNLWIETFLNYATNYPTISAVGGRIERYFPQTIVQKYGSNLVNGQKELNYLPIISFPYIVCANALFRKQDFLSVDGFDTDFYSGNDVDICYKLGLQGEKISICSEAVVFHDNRATICKHFTRFVKYAIYQALLFKKYRYYTHKKFLINTYPYKCIFIGLTKIINSILRTKNMRQKYFWEGTLLIIEGLGVLTGDIIGALKFKVIYI